MSVLAMKKWAIMDQNKWAIGIIRKTKQNSAFPVVSPSFMCSKQCKWLIVSWQHSHCCYIVAATAPIVYDANLWDCECHCVASESRMNFLQLFQSCGLSLNPLLITVCEPEGAMVRVGPQPAGNFLDAFLNWCRHLGSLLDHSHPMKRPHFEANTIHSTVHTKTWHKTEKVLLILWTGYCGNR